MESTIPVSARRLYHSCVTWKIYNFFNGPLELNEPIESPEFITNLRKPVKWRIVITRRIKIGEQYTTETLLKRSASCVGPNHLVVKFRVKLINSNGEVWNDIIAHESFHPGQAVALRTTEKYVNITDLYNPIGFISGIFTITCDFLLDFPLHFEQPTIDVHLSALSDDLNTLQMLGSFTDLDLKVGERTFAVNSVIVKTRSPYIARILKEKPNLRQIDLTTYGSDSQVHGLIVYWYSGDTGKLPRTLNPSTSEFIQNVEQCELGPYVDPENITLSTTFETVSLSIKWVIEDLQFCESLRHLQKRTVYKYVLEEQAWKLYFYLRGYTGMSDYISLYIRETSMFVNLKSVYLQIFFIDENNREYGCKSTDPWSYLQGRYNFPHFMMHRQFEYIRNKLLKNNILRIGCRIKYGTGTVKHDTKHFSGCHDIPLMKEHPYTTLASNLKRLLQSGIMSDITLKIGDLSFKVHTAILAARSRYFYSLLSNREYGTLKTDEIELKDIEPDHLDMILKYMYYAERIQLNLELTLKLYPIVRKYQISVLEGLCSEYLQSHLTVNNAVPVLELAEKAEDWSLKRIAREFIDANRDQISGAERWPNRQ